MKLKTATIYLVLVAVMLASGRAEPARAAYQDLVQTNRLINRSVKFVERDRTGEISTLYLDPATGLVPFGVLGFQAFFGLVDKTCLLPIPWPDVQFDSKTKQFVIRELTTDEVSCLVYNPEVHDPIEAGAAGKIFGHYDLGNLLARERKRLGAGSRGRIYDLAELTNIPVYRQGTRIGRAVRYFMSLDSGMVRLVLLHRSQDGEQTVNKVMVPFPLLKFDEARVAYHLAPDSADLSKAPRFDHFDAPYIGFEAAVDLYRRFGLDGYLE